MSTTNMHDHSEYIESLRAQIIEHHSSLGLLIDGQQPSKKNIYPIYNVTKPSVTNNHATVIMIGRFVCMTIVHEKVVVKEKPAINHVHRYYAQTKPIDTSADKIGNVAFTNSKGIINHIPIDRMYVDLEINTVFKVYNPMEDQEALAKLMRYGFASPTMVATLIDESLREMMKCLPYKQFTYVISDKKSVLYAARHANSSTADMVQIIPSKGKA